MVFAGLLVGACAEDDFEREPDDVEELDRAALGLEEKREVSDRIKANAAGRGIGNPVVYAGVAHHETGLVQCWKDATYHCKGPHSGDCGGPVLAGSGDGPCSNKQGGLGMFQFDAGTHHQTLAAYGSHVLELDGNIDQGLSTIIDKVRNCPNTPPFASDAEVVAWIETAMPGTAPYEVFLSAMAWCYNGCHPDWSCHQPMRQKYRSGIESLLEAFGEDYWYGAPAQRGDVYMLDRRGGAGVTEVHVLAAEGDFGGFQSHSATALHPTDDDIYELGVGDFDGDGHDDVYMILRHGGSGTTEVHVLDAASNFEVFLAHAASALHPTDGELMDIFDFAIGDYDGDGRDDVYAIRRGGDDATEVHVLDAATHFGTFSGHSASALHPTDGALKDVFAFTAGDFNDDARDDLYAISRRGGSGTTEVHVLDAATGFGTFLAHAASALHPTDHPHYEFASGDYDLDGRDDVYMFIRHAATETTEVHVLDAADHFQSFLAHVASALHPTDDDRFELAVGAF